MTCRYSNDHEYLHAGGSHCIERGEQQGCTPRAAGAGGVTLMAPNGPSSVRKRLFVKRILGGGGDRTCVQISLKLAFSITSNRGHRIQLRTIEDRRAFGASGYFLYNVSESTSALRALGNHELANTKTISNVDSDKSVGIGFAKSARS